MSETLYQTMAVGSLSFVFGLVLCGIIQEWRR